MRAALFDAGDTLLHERYHKRDRFCWLLEQAGITVPEDVQVRTRAAVAVERFWQNRYTYPKRGSLEFWGDYFTVGLRELGIPQTAVADVIAVFRHAPRTHWLDPEAIPLLTALRERGYKIGIVSNWNGTLASVCEEAGLAPYIDYIGDSTAVGIEKPDPAFFHHVLEQLGVEPSQAFHVGDCHTPDVGGAQAAGVTPILLDVLGCEERPAPHRITRLSEVLELCEKL